MSCEHIIGMWNDYDNTQLVTLNELIDKNNLHNLYFYSPAFCSAVLSGTEFSPDALGDDEEKWKKDMRKHFDFRCSTPLTRFIYCPMCGEKIDWKYLKGIWK